MYDIIQNVVDELRPILYRDGEWYLDYVRIRIKCKKGNCKRRGHI